MKNRVLVIGATGNLGGEVLARLKARGEPVRAAARSRTRPPCEEVTAFDFDRPETFGPALDGVDRVFLIARPADEEADRVALPFIDEMKRRGVRRVVNVTAMGVERAPHARALHNIELYLERTGLSCVHLRPNFFSQIFANGPLLAGIRASGTIVLPAADAKISFVDARDVAEVAVLALVREERSGVAYTLTGADAIDHAEVARAISAASERAVRYVAVDDEGMRRFLLDAGASGPRIARLLRFYRLVRAGEASSVRRTVRELLGRVPISFQQFAHDHAARWKAV
jgi:uncharacterized protein YbjT (DUF2867 family)